MTAHSGHQSILGLIATLAACRCGRRSTIRHRCGRQGLHLKVSDEQSDVNTCGDDETPTSTASLQERYDSLKAMYDKISAQLKNNIARTNELYSQQQSDKSQIQQLLCQQNKYRDDKEYLEDQVSNQQIELELRKKEILGYQRQVEDLKHQLSKASTPAPPSEDTASKKIIQELQRELDEYKEKYQMVYENYINDHNQLIFISKQSSTRTLEKTNELSRITVSCLGQNEPQDSTSGGFQAARELSIQDAAEKSAGGQLQAEVMRHAPLMADVEDGKATGPRFSNTSLAGEGILKGDRRPLPHWGAQHSGPTDFWALACAAAAGAAAAAILTVIVCK